MPGPTSHVATTPVMVPWHTCLDVLPCAFLVVVITAKSTAVW